MHYHFLLKEHHATDIRPWLIFPSLEFPPSPSQWCLCTWIYTTNLLDIVPGLLLSLYSKTNFLISIVGLHHIILVPVKYTCQYKDNNTIMHLRELSSFVCLYVWVSTWVILVCFEEGILWLIMFPYSSLFYCIQCFFE